MIAAPRTVLFFRLSSMGDIIMSTAALSALAPDEKAIWVTAREYASLIEGHPKILKVLPFDRKLGIGEWLRFCRRIFTEEKFDRVVDLHLMVRTRLARLLYFGLRRKHALPRWEEISKERLRFIGYCIFKGTWPKRWRPSRFVDRFSLIASQGQRIERPNLQHLKRDELVSAIESQIGPYVAVMPSSLWASKEWPVERYAQVCLDLAWPVVVMGTLADEPSQTLARILREKGKKFFDGVGKYSLPESAAILAGAKGYFGSDTGLAHLAEAMGTRAVIVLGANVEDGGFGPWHPRSRLAEVSLWCRPCGKDGRYCIRPIKRQHCLKLLTPEKSLNTLQKALNDQGSA